MTRRPLAYFARICVQLSPPAKPVLSRKTASRLNARVKSASSRSTRWGVSEVRWLMKIMATTRGNRGAEYHWDRRPRGRFAQGRFPPHADDSGEEKRGQGPRRKAAAAGAAAGRADRVYFPSKK